MADKPPILNCALWTRCELHVAPIAALCLEAIAEFVPHSFPEQWTEKREGDTRVSSDDYGAALELWCREGASRGGFLIAGTPRTESWLLATFVCRGGRQPVGYLKLSTRVREPAMADGARGMLSLLRRWVELTDADFARLCLKDEWEQKNVIRNYEEPDGVNPYKVFNTDITEGLPGVYWATYLGRPYLDWIGEEVIDASPWPNIEKHAGGYLLLRSESPAAWRNEADLDSRLREHLGERRFFDISAPERVLDILKLEIPDYYSGATAEKLIARGAVQAASPAVQKKPARRRARRRLPAGQAASVIERLSFFRRRGFFADFDNRADDDVARELYNLQIDKWGTGFTTDGPMGDLDLLAWDRKRVWWEDAEADVGPGNRIYESVLPQLGEISRGAFEPTEVSEEWSGETGPISLSFTYRNARQTVIARYLDDYLDLGILRQINAIISASRLAYYVFEEFDQSAFVVVLGIDERNVLESERGWRFRDERDLMEDSQVPKKGSE